MPPQVIDHAPVSLLVVCTGNICRSPAAQLLMSSELGHAAVITSAGTRAMVGRAISAPMKALLEHAGMRSNDFRARQVREHMVRSAEVAVGMTRDHRRDLVELWPAAVRRSFTLLELARVLSDISEEELPQGPPSHRLRSAVAIAATRRRHMGTDIPVDDIADPYQQSMTEYARAYEEIRQAVAVMSNLVKV